MNCPKCHQKIAEGVKFCPECGTRVSGISKPSGAEAVGGEASGLLQNSLQTVAGPGEAAAAPALRGVPLAERYEVLGEIGRGGFAVVCKARDKKLDRVVAVKRLLPGRQEGPGAVEALDRFRREAQTIANLNHRNIVQVYDHDRDEEGDYIVMEFIEGGSLRDLLKERKKLPLAEALGLMRGICHGLALAHRKNLIHRDLKPANILLRREGEEVVPKIVDFGLARVGADSELSASGRGMGTPWYMPPEQRRNAKSVNHTADLYALGKTFYEMLTGEVPDQVDPDKLSPEVARAILHCVKALPEERYFTADDLWRDLEAAGGGAPSGASAAWSAARGDACPSCGKGNPEGVKFCEHCGAGLTRRCPECERENPVARKFCGGCGTEAEAFLAAQDTHGKMGRYRAGRRWSRVTKEQGLMPEKVRLPGAKGGAILKEIEAWAREAEVAQARCHELAREIEEAMKGEDWEAALLRAKEYRQLASSEESVEELVADLGKRIEARDFEAARAAAAEAEEASDFKRAGQVWQVFLAKHPEGEHAAEARGGRRRAQEAMEAEQRQREEEEACRQRAAADAERRQMEAAAEEAARKIRRRRLLKLALAGTIVVLAGCAFALGRLRTAWRWEAFDRPSAGGLAVDLGNGVKMLMERVPGGYWVGRTEVTQQQWEAVMGNNPSGFKGARRPVEQVSWHDATNFCAKVTAKLRVDGKLPEGMECRLPTEREWETYVGDADLKGAVTSKDSQRSSTEEVGSKKPNQYGLYDVRGNVWEWCLNRDDDTHDWRVLRGASWINDNPDGLAVGYRLNGGPELSHDGLGFRCVVAVASSP